MNKHYSSFFVCSGEQDINIKVVQLICPEGIKVHETKINVVHRYIHIHMHIYVWILNPFIGSNLNVILFLLRKFRGISGLV